MRSVWKAHYEIVDGDVPALTIQEANPWIKFLDGLIGEIPVIGMLTGYFFHPAYMVVRQDGTAVMRLEKQPAFLEGRYSIEKLASLSEPEEIRVLLGLLMVVVLERSRG
jgi:hypothetical protein